MIKFLIDTSFSNIILGLYQDNQPIKEIIEENDHQLSSRIFPLIDQLFQSTEKKEEEVDEIVVVNGPGSFTGVRISVTIAKTYAWSLKKKIIPVSELQVMASTKTDTDYLIPMIDARRNCVYAGIYDRDLNTVLNDQYLSIEDLKKEVEKLDGSYTYLCDTKLDQLDHCIPSHPNLSKVLKYHENDVGINPHQVNPNYLKKTEAEENLNK